MVERHVEEAPVDERTKSKPTLLDGLHARWPGLRVVLLIFVLSRLAFYVAALYGSWAVPEMETEPARVAVKGPTALNMHWRWDAVHYYSIAIGGYNFYYSNPMPGNEPTGLPAFFPMFPLLTRIMSTLLGGLRPPAPLPIWAASPVPLLAGVLVVHGAALLAFWLLFRLAREETGDEATARRAVLYTAIFPLAFYYAIPYTESLFLATTVGAFLAARNQQWVRAGLWGAAASATRLTGLLLLPVLLIELALAWRRGELRPPAWGRAVLGLLLVPVGLLLFMLHLWQRTGDPLAFLHAQAFWNRQRLFPLTTVWRGIRYALPPNWIERPDLYARNLLQTLIVVGFLVVLIVSVREWRPSYLVYGLLLFSLSLSSPLSGAWTMQSQGRYAMILFPVYITLARWGRRPAVHQAILLLWLPLLGLLTALYLHWHFVA